MVQCSIGWAHMSSYMLVYNRPDTHMRYPTAWLSFGYGKLLLARKIFGSKIFFFILANVESAIPSRDLEVFAVLIGANLGIRKPCAILVMLVPSFAILVMRVPSGFSPSHAGS